MGDKKEMKFEHYATGEVIEVEEKTDKVVFHREKDKYYRLTKDKQERVVLSKTSFIEADN